MVTTTLLTQTPMPTPKGRERMIVTLLTERWKIFYSTKFLVQSPLEGYMLVFSISCMKQLEPSNSTATLVEMHLKINEPFVSNLALHMQLHEDGSTCQLLWVPN